MKAEEIFEMIKNLDADERYKLLDLMYDEYYNTGLHPKGVEFADD